MSSFGLWRARSLLASFFLTSSYKVADKYSPYQTTQSMIKGFTACVVISIRILFELSTKLLSRVEIRNAYISFHASCTTWSIRSWFLTTLYSVAACGKFRVNSNPQPHISRPTAWEARGISLSGSPLRTIFEKESPLARAMRDKSNQYLVSDLLQVLSNRDQLGRWCSFETLCAYFNGGSATPTGITFYGWAKTTRAVADIGSKTVVLLPRRQPRDHLRLV